MSQSTGKLILARHHQSEWNEKNQWTGTRDVGLTTRGRAAAEQMGQAIKDIPIDKAISSELIRAIDTLKIMLAATGRTDLTIEKTPAINERDYGEYTGRNKWEMKELFGEEVFNCVRREWNCPVPGGETLKMVYNRTTPYYLKQIQPALQAGQNVLLVAHMNSLRALVKYLEQIPDEKIKMVEIPFGQILIYEINNQGRATGKQIIETESAD